MRKKLKITIGKTYNRLTVMKQVASNVFDCECKCGKICQANSVQLVRGKKKSCGCQKIDSAKQLCIERNTTHGLSHTKEYAAMYNKRTREKYKERIRERKRRYSYQNKIKVFKAYCHEGIVKCARCGETDDRVLNIDHIEGGGRAHQRKVGDVYRDLIRRKFPKGFQVLCQNCNWTKMCDNNEAHRSQTPLSDIQKKSKQKLRAKLISFYSHGKNCCTKCGNHDFRVLCLDHIDGGGCQELRKNGNPWLYLKKSNFPSGIQVLCQNCNRRKMYENNEWKPHKKHNY